MIALYRSLDMCSDSSGRGGEGGGGVYRLKILLFQNKYSSNEKNILLRDNLVLKDIYQISLFCMSVYDYLNPALSPALSPTIKHSVHPSRTPLLTPLAVHRPTPHLTPLQLIHCAIQVEK